MHCFVSSCLFWLNTSSISRKKRCIVSITGTYSMNYHPYLNTLPLFYQSSYINYIAILRCTVLSYLVYFGWKLVLFLVKSGALLVLQVLTAWITTHTWIHYRFFTKVHTFYPIKNNRTKNSLQFEMRCTIMSYLVYLGWKLLPVLVKSGALLVSQVFTVWSTTHTWIHYHFLPKFVKIHCYTLMNLVTQNYAHLRLPPF